MGYMGYTCRPRPSTRLHQLNSSRRPSHCDDHRMICSPIWAVSIDPGRRWWGRAAPGPSPSQPMPTAPARGTRKFSTNAAPEDIGTVAGEFPKRTWRRCQERLTRSNAQVPRDTWAGHCRARSARPIDRHRCSGRLNRSCS